MQGKALVTIDWGTTNRRIFLLDDDGAVVRREADSRGVTAIPPGGFPAEMADLRARFFAYLGHLPGLKADLSALRNLEFLCGLHGRRPKQSPEAAMGIVGLAGFEDAPLRTLSAGQKKRLGLARLWLSPAPLWLLDEPYANLDLDGIALVNALVGEHLADGGATLVTTHGAYAEPPVRTKLLELA